MWRPLLAALALCATVAASCTANRPLHKGPDAALPPPVDSATEDLPTAPRRCSRPGDVCCPTAGASVCSDGLVCDLAIETCIVCGNAGQPCCTRGCNLGLACDHAVSSTPLGLCTETCGRQDMACCSQGVCEDGFACTTEDETGTCKACGLPGLKCCRGDCWIGTCALTAAPRFCVQCGEKGQPCCEGGGTEPSGCDQGVACDKAPGDLRGVCVDTCGFEGKPCCRGGGCLKPLACTTEDVTGICVR